MNTMSANIRSVSGELALVQIDADNAFASHSPTPSQKKETLDQSHSSSTTTNVANEHHGFTLVELLVVIAIISVLAGLLLPALESSLEVARRIACLNNTRGQGQALRFFAQDHDNFLPWRGYHSVGSNQYLGDLDKHARWDRDPLNTYLNVNYIGGKAEAGSILRCPSSGFEINRWDYLALNVSTKMWTNDNASLWRGQYYMVLMDSLDPNLGLSMDLPYPNIDSDGPASENAPCHVGNDGYFPAGANVSHVDGHGEWYALDQLTPDSAFNYFLPTDMPVLYMGEDLNGFGSYWVTQTAGGNKSFASPSLGAARRGTIRKTPPF